MGPSAPSHGIGVEAARIVGWADIGHAGLGIGS
jgi:hypothetical protein